MRPAFGLAYLLCRYADTIADTELLPAQKRLFWIKEFPALVRQEDLTAAADLSQALTGTSANPYEAQLITHLPDCLRALSHISAEQKPFIYDVVSSVCQGMQIDLTTFPNAPKAPPVAFKTDDDLKNYCRLMGGKPGLFWSRLIRNAVPVQMPQEPFFDIGQKIGDALQMVNILRDLPKDLQNGRCYFPQTDLSAAGLQPADLLNPQTSAAFAPVRQKWTRFAAENLSCAYAYYRALPAPAWRLRAAVAWPILWTADTFLKLNKTTSLLNPQQRVKISRTHVYLTLLATPLLLNSTLFDKVLQRKLKQLS